MKREKNDDRRFGVVEAEDVGTMAAAVAGVVVVVAAVALDDVADAVADAAEAACL